MDIKYPILLFFAGLLTDVATAQKNEKIIGSYYYLDFPRSDIFGTAFSEPNGKSDPGSIPSTSEEITDEDLEVSIGAAKQTKYSERNRDNNFLLNSWSHVRGLYVSSEYYKIKYTQVKNASWEKYRDQSYHIIEAISADSVIIKIYKNKGDTTGSALLQKIAALFVAPHTVVGQVLSLLGTTDSTARTQKDIVKLKSRDKDTVTLMLNNNKVYFAVRYARINEPKTSKVFSLLAGRKIDRAPVCGLEVHRDPPDTLSFTLGPKQRTFNLMRSNCVIENHIVQALFVNDFPDGGTFYITKEYQGSHAQNKKDAIQKVDTVYRSSSIDFSDRYYNDFYNISRVFVANEKAQKKGSKNTLVTCDVKFDFNPEKRVIRVLNYLKEPENYYHTCIYTMSADIEFFPK